MNFNWAKMTKVASSKGWLAKYEGFEGAEGITEEWQGNSLSITVH